MTDVELLTQVEKIRDQLAEFELTSDALPLATACVVNVRTLLAAYDEARADVRKWKDAWTEQLALLDQRDGPPVYSAVLHRAEAADAAGRTLVGALQPFRSSREWNLIKVWIKNACEDGGEIDRGIEVAARLTRWQEEVASALASPQAQRWADR